MFSLFLFTLLPKEALLRGVALRLEGPFVPREPTGVGEVCELLFAKQTTLALALSSSNTWMLSYLLSESVSMDV